MNLSYGPFISLKQAQAAGIKFYYTGKPCKNGHCCDRRVISRACSECLKVNQASHRLKTRTSDKPFKANPRMTHERFCAKVFALYGESVDCSKAVWAAGGKKHTVFICKTHGEWTARPDNLLQGKGCPECGRIKGGISRRINPERAMTGAEHAKRSRESNPLHPLINRLRSRVHQAIQAQNSYKNSKTVQLIGCSYADLKTHLESLFLDGMSWDNFGLWHIDHIRPCASFDLTDPEQQKQCFHYTNLQPLWALDNRRKYCKWEAA